MANRGSPSVQSFMSASQAGASHASVSQSPAQSYMGTQRMNIDKELLKLMRLGRNRRCCDCDAELADYRNIWASVDKGCFVCVNCLAVHRALNLKTKSVNMDIWTEAEIRFMKGMGNVLVNEIYERYVPSGWTKPTPDAEQQARELWIRAKYQKSYFVVPHYHEEGGGASYQSPAAMSQVLPIRLVDYFVVVGVKSLQLDMAKIRANTPPESVPVKPEVLDCFPEADSHLGCPLPEHIAQFISPQGLFLSSVEQPPMLFHFVLTDVSGVKMYGVTLHVFEEMDPEQLSAAVAQAHQEGGRGHGSGGLPPWLRQACNAGHTSFAPGAHSIGNGHPPQEIEEVTYSPKALVLLSHYPFYNVYSQFLQNLYRISLSEAPLPLERYISNFVCEVPLPPQGQVEVIYALPDRTLSIKRPPKNRLPLVDFSYRPLTACLSTDNILTLFGCLLIEDKVALCSKHLALLNPVAEGLLSLLFPFVWQGAYIPVMPAVMTDIMEAPVPFLVGIHSQYLAHTPEDRRPQGVVFVDLDNDVVHLGWDESKHVPRRRPSLPEREAHKLKVKLHEHSQGTHRSRHNPPGGSGIPLGSASKGAKASPPVSNTMSLDKVDLAFPNSEHLLPISSFATEQGLTVPSASQSNKPGFMSRMTGDKKRKMPTPGRKTAISHARRNSGGAAGGSGGNFNFNEEMSLLDPRNNTGMADGFNASEIRAAFLRFFVSVLRSYQAFVVLPTKEEPYPETLFNRDAFLRDASHLDSQCYEWMQAMLTSQMFERFLEERVTNPRQPEIRFFEESIVAKMNRSKTNPIKRDTPFLSDASDAHSQSFNPPPPSNWGLPDDGSHYAYASFPSLSKERYGNVRWAKRLFKTPDQHRNVSSVNQQEMLSRTARQQQASAGGGALQREGTLSLSLGHSQMDVSKVLLCVVKAQALWRMHSGQRRFRRQREAVGVVSRAWRARQATVTDRLMFLTIVHMVKDVQRVFRGHLARKFARRRMWSVVHLQAWVRMQLLSRNYRRTRRAAVRMQARARARRCRSAFLVVRELVILAQAAVRGWFKRRVARRERDQRIRELRVQVFELWNLASVELVYRSKFWVLFQGGGFLDLAVHEDEALRLWRDLGLVDSHKEHLARVHFNQTFGLVTEWLLKTRSARQGEGGDQRIWNPPGPARRASTAMGGGNRAQAAKASRSGVSRTVLVTLGMRRGSGPAGATPPPLEEQPHIKVAVQRLELEKETLYKEIKRQSAEGDKGGRLSLSLFHMFGLEKQKRRKRKLLGMLWQDLRLADASAEVVLSVFRDHMDARHAWVQNKRDLRVRADLLCTVQACITSIHHMHQANLQKKGIVIPPKSRRPFGSAGNSAVASSVGSYMGLTGSAGPMGQGYSFGAPAELKSSGLAREDHWARGGNLLAAQESKVHV